MERDSTRPAGTRPRGEGAPVSLRLAPTAGALMGRPGPAPAPGPSTKERVSAVVGATTVMGTDAAMFWLTDTV